MRASEGWKRDHLGALGLRNQLQWVPGLLGASHVSWTRCFRSLYPELSTGMDHKSSKAIAHAQAGHGEKDQLPKEGNAQPASARLQQNSNPTPVSGMPSREGTSLPPLLAGAGSGSTVTSGGWARQGAPSPCQGGYSRFQMGPASSKPPHPSAADRASCT